LAHIGQGMAGTRDTSNRLKGGFATRAIHTGHNPGDGFGRIDAALHGLTRFSTRLETPSDLKNDILQALDAIHL
jgi:hypothetical protein